MSIQAAIAPSQSHSQSAEERVGHYDWKALARELDSQGCAVLETLLRPDECEAIAALYHHEEHFRSHVVMASERASIAISNIPCPSFSPACARRCIGT